MKHYLACLLLLIGCTVVPAGRATTLLLKAESLEMPGGWQISSGSVVVRQFLVAGTGARQAPAAGAIDVPHAGHWRLWVRSKDYPDYLPGTRTFTVRLGQTRSATTFGKHGHREFGGWAWEDGGSFDLPTGPTLVVLGDEVKSSARCDALLLTDNASYTPSGEPWKLGKQAAASAPLQLSEASRSTFLPPSLQDVTEPPVAMLQNENVRLTFHTAKTGTGTAIVMRAAARKDGKWQVLNDDAGIEGYRVLARPPGSDPKLVSSRVHPTWDISLSPAIEVHVGQATVSTRLGTATAPWASAQCFAVRPIQARQVDAATVELDFAPLAAGQLKVRWHLPAERPDADVSLTFKPAGPGRYSLGYHAPLACAPDKSDFLLLPFLYHGHRFPEEPGVMLSATTPTPLAMLSKAGLSCALVADSAQIPFAWPGASNSVYALGLHNESDLAQPMLYTPVMGGPGSLSDGGPVQGHFHLWIQPGDWYASYRRIADELFQLTDYRRPTTASLSDTALNLLDLMRNEKASGWDARAKGPWNIETRNVVTQSSPLTYLSLYLLTGDEDFYRRFALPSLEFLISRPSPHFAAEQNITTNYYHHQPMRGPVPMFGAVTFASAAAMTQGHSPVFGQLCLNDKGQPRPTHGGGHTQLFEDALALYRLTGDRHWLDEAMTGADKYIAANLRTLPSRDLGDQPFINVSFIPDWEGLLDLYQATGEKRFLDASCEGARWLLTTLWTQPAIPPGEITINPGGLFENARHVWWMGDRLFRLGRYDGAATTNRIELPPAALPEHRVPSWQVSNVGLGLEQPVTYTRRETHGNIIMSTWAPNLLRLQRATGDDAFRTAARNATIGRFANYPGYYIDGMTDQYQRPDYPLTGPDVTSLYVHHIPPFAAYVLDYLFTDAEERSAGTVAFPWVRQSGYVWFDSRLRGHAPGKVYGRTAWPWLHRTAATVDNVNVDRVLAHGDGAFFVILLNQVNEEQTVRVHFDERVLGRSLEGAVLGVHQDNRVAATLTVKQDSTMVRLNPRGITVLTLDGVHIDVPTHRIMPSAFVPLPQTPALLREVIPDTKLEAVGTEINVPPFTWRDLYVYLTAGINDCRAATLHYRVGDGPEQEAKDTEFPWEFSIRLTDTSLPVTWRMDVQLADGSWHHTLGSSGQIK